MQLFGVHTISTGTPQQMHWKKFTKNLKKKQNNKTTNYGKILKTDI